MDEERKEDFIIETMENIAFKLRKENKLLELRATYSTLSYMCEMKVEQLEERINKLKKKIEESKQLEKDTLLRIEELN